MWGRMCVLKNSFLLDKGMYHLILLRSASFLLMVDRMVVISFSHDKLWSIVTPNSLSDFTFSKVSLFITIERFLWFSGRESCFCQVVINIDLVFIALADIQFSTHHLVISFISVFRWPLIYLVVLAVDVTVLSSAYILISLCVATNGKWLIKMMNNKGPSIDPCGIPIFMDSLSDNLPLNDVHWSLS